jgi:predicted nucleic acid-binding protein
MQSLEDYELAAELFRRVARGGHTVRQSSDCMIAAVCLREDVPRLHDDVDFTRIAEVSELRLVA